MARRGVLRRLAFVGAGGLLAAIGLALALPWPPPNVVVVVADTLRADRLGAYGHRGGLTPFLDRLAARGIVFTAAYATSSWTPPSIASLFVSRYPTQHHVNDYDARLPEAEVTLAERLHAARYVTGGFNANLLITPKRGYAQGFDHFRTFASSRKTTADRVGRESVRWLERLTPRWRDRIRHPWSRPRFFYYQLMETHAPYDPGRESSSRRERDLLHRLRLAVGDRSRAAATNKLLTSFRFYELGPADVTFLEALYDAEVALLDYRLERLFARLERHGILDGAVVVFTSDHGEEFRDHGGLLHGHTLFNELIRVPLILVLPGHPGGRTVDANVSLVDVAPTLLDVVGLPPEPRFEGASLLPLVTGARRSQDALAELLPNSHREGIRLHEIAFMRERLKLIVPPDAATQPVLYDLASDPWETKPDPPVLQRHKTPYQEAARQAVAALGRRMGVPERAVADEQTRARLRALGYAN